MKLLICSQKQKKKDTTIFVKQKIQKTNFIGIPSKKFFGWKKNIFGQIFPCNANKIKKTRNNTCFPVIRISICQKFRKYFYKKFTEKNLYKKKEKMFRLL